MKASFKNNKRLAFFILGLINALPFTFDNLFFISWIAFVPFFVMLIKHSENSTEGKKIFSYIFLFFFAYHFGIYHFFMSLVPMSFIGMGFFPSLLLMLLAWCFLSAIHALMLSVFAFGVTRLKISPPLKIIALAVSVVVAQYLMSLGKYGFTWARVSLPQSTFLPLMQSASMLGPYFVDLLLLFVNALIAIAVVTDKYTLYGTLSAMLFFVNFVFGYCYMQKDYEVSNSGTVSVIQGNVLTDSKWKSESSYATYMNQTLLLDEAGSLVVWTETAIPTDLNDSKKILSELKAYTRLSGNEMIVGAFYSSNVGRRLNGAYYVADNHISDNVYFKRRMVPFGEFLPLKGILRNLPFLSSINLSAIDLYPGYSSAVMETKKGNVGCLICFDSIFPQFARESVADGAELLVILTNDSWYKDHTAVYQHNNQAKWRAVENGRYVVRAANSGISSFITPNGEVLSYLPPLVKETLTGEVSYINGRTVYNIVGDIVIIPLIIFLLICIFITIKKLPFIQRKLRKSYISSDNADI